MKGANVVLRFSFSKHRQSNHLPRSVIINFLTSLSNYLAQYFEFRKLNLMNLKKLPT